MRDAWSDLARQHGRRCTVSLIASDTEVDTCTAAQIQAINGVVQPLLRGNETRALDFGCGTGRFTPMLAEWAAWAHGYEPSPDLLALCDAQERRNIIWRSFLPTFTFDIVLVALVLGEPDLDVIATNRTIANALAADGLLVLLEHTAEPEPGQWWQFRPISYYCKLFRKVGISLSPIGHCDQLGTETTIFAGYHADFA